MGYEKTPMKDLGSIIGVFWANRGLAGLPRGRGRKGRDGACQVGISYRQPSGKPRAAANDDDHIDNSMEVTARQGDAACCVPTKLKHKKLLRMTVRHMWRTYTGCSKKGC